MNLHDQGKVEFEGLQGCLLMLLLLGFLLLLYLVFVGLLFRRYTVLFLAIWLLAPLVAWSGRYRSVAGSFSEAGARRVRIALMTIAIVGSCAFATRYFDMRDQFGRAFIPGYSSYPVGHVDMFGELYPWRSVDVSHSYHRVTLWTFAAIYFGLCLAAPMATWRFMKSWFPDVGRYKFQRWAVRKVGGRPVTEAEKKKGIDRGIDGEMTFVADRGQEVKRILISVKHGRVKPTMVPELRVTVEREDAAIGVLVTQNPPTQEMEAEAVKAGWFESPMWKDRRFRRLQIITAEELWQGKRPDIPPSAKSGMPRSSRITPRKTQGPEQLDQE